MKTFISIVDLLERIKICANLKNDAELARFLGKSPSVLSNWKARNSIDYDLIFSKCEHFNLDWLLTGRGAKFIRDKQDVQILHQPKCPEILDDQEVILYDVNAAANLKTLFDNKSQNILGKISIPNIPKCDGALFINGDSMYPLLKSGDIVGYKELNNFQHVIYGEMYLISFEQDGDEFLTVKYVNKSEKPGYIKLVSYNAHHCDMDIPISTINAIALIKFSVRKNTMI